jgi:uncharacterized membrane protein YdjX (TVP38/TMEM64 family)
MTAETLDTPVLAMPKSRRTFYRLGALAIVIVTLFIVGIVTGVSENLSVESLREMLLAAGTTGVLLYLGVFAVSNVLQLPGMLFATAGIVAYGGVLGGVVALVGAVLAMAVTFIVVRLIGGKALGEVKKPFMRKLLAKLESRPVRAVFLLRLLFQTSPQLNFALGLSTLRFRDYIVGTALGMMPVMIVLSLVVEFSGI